MIIKYDEGDGELRRIRCLMYYHLPTGGARMKFFTLTISTLQGISEINKRKPFNLTPPERQ